MAAVAVAAATVALLLPEVAAAAVAVAALLLPEVAVAAVALLQEVAVAPWSAPGQERSLTLVTSVSDEN